MQTGRKSNELNNKGFSLVELIVVIAIIAILGGVIGISAYTASRYNIKKMAETFDKGLSRTQTLCMGKDNDNTYLRVFEESGSIKIEVTRVVENADGTKEKIKDTKEWDLGSSNNTVTYVTSAGDKTLAADGAFAVSFDRASGAFKEMVELDASGMMTGYKTDVYLKEVTFSNDSTSNTVVVFQHTGKHEIR